MFILCVNLIDFTQDRAKSASASVLHSKYGIGVSGHAAPKRSIEEPHSLSKFHFLILFKLEFLLSSLFDSFYIYIYLLYL